MEDWLHDMTVCALDRRVMMMGQAGNDDGTDGRASWHVYA